MPFTPFHFGPGLLVKSLLNRHFSFLVFVFTQVLIDLETLTNILLDRYPLHGFFHSYVGASLLIIPISILSILGFQIWIRFMRFLQRDREAKSSPPTPPKLSVVFISSAVGAWSHVLLDSIMHADTLPFQPFSQTNSLLGLISLFTLHMGCILSGILGILILGFSFLKNAYSRSKT